MINEIRASGRDSAAAIRGHASDRAFFSREERCFTGDACCIRYLGAGCDVSEVRSLGPCGNDVFTELKLMTRICRSVLTLSLA